MNKVDVSKIFTAASGLCFLIASFMTGLGEPEKTSLIFYSLAIGFGGYFVALGAVKGLIKQRFLNIDFLVMIAAVGALYIHQIAEAAAVIFFFSLAEAFEAFGVSHSKKALESLLNQSPQVATLKNAKIVPIDSVEIGAVIMIRPGELIPLDGTVQSGSSSVDESTITGESMPQEKAASSQVFAGTLNHYGALEVVVTKESKDSTFSKIAALVEEAQKSRAPVQAFIDQFAKYYTPSIVGLALLITFVPPLVLGGTFTSWLYRALVLLVIACPCALVISTPIAIASAIGAASRQGILLKGGHCLDLLSKLKVISFDKTRTLTLGQPQISDVVLVSGFTEEELLIEAAGVEKFSTHPLSASIINYAKQKGVIAHDMENYKNNPGKGGEATCLTCNEGYKVGSLAFLKTTLTIPNDVLEKAEALEKQGKTIIVVSKANAVMGILGISDVVRSEAKKTIQVLNQLHIQTVMMSGDNTYSANFVAKNLLIKEVYASLLPNEKAVKIEELKNKFGTVAMVGDGINDAPSLAAATLGIAMGIDGSDMAIETADITLMNSNLLNIPGAILLGKKTMGIIKANIVFSLSVKGVFLLLAILGVSSLSIAIVADSGIAILVILNSLRLFYFKPMSYSGRL